MACCAAEGHGEEPRRGTSSRPRTPRGAPGAALPGMKDARDAPLRVGRARRAWGASAATTTTTHHPRRYEPHWVEISRPDQVQIYEAILGDAKGGVTTGLLTRRSAT